MKPVHHPSADEITLPGLMAALSDPVRVQIVRSLAAQGECSCGSFDLDIAAFHDRSGAGARPASTGSERRRQLAVS